MDINKEKLSERFKEEDWNYVFKEAMKIADFVVSGTFKIYNKDVKEDMIQECLLNFYKKILQNKVDPNKNLFAFIWKNSRFRVLEMLRKQRKRNDIVHFFSYDEVINSDYIDSESGAGNRYLKEAI